MYLVFFFQAEDGIRDLVRSRGLGDVYKRQGRGGQYTYHGPGQRVAYVMLDLKKRGQDVRAFVAVSYTHLTLPTIYSV